MMIRMRRTENITQFSKRFWTIYSQIEDTTDRVVIKSFKQPILLGNELWKDLVRFPVVTVKTLMAQARKIFDLWTETRLQKARRCSQLPPRGATYQKLVTEMLQAELGKTIEVYFDDMVVKSKRSQDYLADQSQTFNILKKFQTRAIQGIQIPTVAY